MTTEEVGVVGSEPECRRRAMGVARMLEVEALLMMMSEVEATAFQSKAFSPFKARSASTSATRSAMSGQRLANERLSSSSPSRNGVERIKWWMPEYYDRKSRTAMHMCMRRVEIQICGEVIILVRRFQV